MFRDTSVTLAQHEREKAELKQKLEVEQNESDDLQKKLDEANEKINKLEKKNKGQTFKKVKEKMNDLFMSPADRRMKHNNDHWGTPKMRSWSEARRNPFRQSIGDRVASGGIQGLVALGFVCFVGLMVYNAYQYFYGIQEGVVYDKSYTPPYTTTSPVYDKDGHRIGTDVTHHPEVYRIFIRQDEETNSYAVTSGTYNNTGIGQWFCFVDWFHDESNCHGPNANGGW